MFACDRRVEAVVLPSACVFVPTATLMGEGVSVQRECWVGLLIQMWGWQCLGGS